MKYMGSKSRIKKEIVPIINRLIEENAIENFVDLFCGGCNIVDSVVCNNRFANDKSTPLIELFKGVVYENKPLPDSVSRELYSKVREHHKDDTYEQWFIGAVGFLASYNGRFFDGGFAKPNISKDGKVRDYYNEAKRNLLKQTEILKGVQFSNLDYAEFKIPDNSLVYCDIPYQNTKQYNTSIGFDYDKFWNFVKETSKNHIVLVSEESSPSEFTVVWQQEVTRTQNNRSRQKAVEKLFTYVAEA